MPLPIVITPTKNDTTAKFKAGLRYYDDVNDRWLQYVEFCDGDGNVTAVIGQVLTWVAPAADDDEFDYHTVTNDYSYGQGVTAFAGILITAPSDAEFCWICFEATKIKVLTDGGVSATDKLVVHNVDGEADTMADGEEEQVFGVARIDDTAAVEYTYASITRQGS